MRFWSLNKLRTEFVQRRTMMLGAFGIILVFLISIIILLQQTKIAKPPQAIPSNIPPPISQQPVVNGRFDQTAPISQRSKNAIAKLGPQLPYRPTITTSTGQVITFAVFTKPRDPFTLYVETLGINFQIQSDDVNLTKTVQDFRDTANAIFGFLKQNGVSPADVFISWGGRAYVQKNAEAWLVESEKYPKVIKQGDKFVFETLPKP